jgi:hypothetical protein
MRWRRRAAGIERRAQRLTVAAADVEEAQNGQ